MKKRAIDTIFTWIGLLIAVPFVWIISTSFLVLFILFLDYYFRILMLVPGWLWALIITIPTIIAEFFITELISPVHKRIVAIVVSVLIILWQIFFLDGLSHMAY